MQSIDYEYVIQNVNNMNGRQVIVHSLLGCNEVLIEKGLLESIQVTNPAGLTLFTDIDCSGCQNVVIRNRHSSEFSFGCRYLLYIWNYNRHKSRNIS